VATTGSSGPTPLAVLMPELRLPAQESKLLLAIAGPSWCEGAWPERLVARVRARRESKLLVATSGGRSHGWRQAHGPGLPTLGAVGGTYTPRA
jgi:hypothetical protein